MEGLNAPLVKNLAALLQDALAIASALQDNNDPLSRDVRESLYAQLNQIQERIADGSRERPQCVRGGCRCNLSSTCRSAFRGRFQPDDAINDVGFRVVCLAPCRAHAIPLEDRHG